MKHLAILGASGHGKVVADAAISTTHWNEFSFFDDAWPDCNANGQWDVVGDTKLLLQSLNQFDGVVVAIGNNKIRQEKHLFLTSRGASLVTIIHPSAYISSSATIGIGSVIFANAVVNVDSSIGSGCIINTGATVDHDCRIAEFAHISPGAHIAGNVNIGTRGWVGIGASIIQGICIGDDVIVGAGSSVIQDVQATLTIAGLPAKPI